MKVFVKITATLSDGNVCEWIETFDSELEYVYNWDTPTEKDGKPIVVLKSFYLKPEEIREYLKPYLAAVIEADRKKAEAKAILDDAKKANKALFELTGDGYYFQDDEGVVYKTDTCDGKFVYFEPIEVKRTRRDGESKGSLSMTEARENGFVVEGK